MAATQARPVSGDRAREILRSGPAGGHETLIAFWMRLIDLALESGLDGEQTVRRLSFPRLPLAHYSLAVLDSPEARRTCVEPDLEPLRLPADIPDDLLEPLLAFEALELTRPQWTHECHLRVALALYRLCGRSGLCLMRQGILRLNSHLGIPQSPEGGYHETLTRFWYEEVGRTWERLQDPQQLLSSLKDPGLPLRAYHKATLMSWQARTEWVEPDLPRREFHPQRGIDPA